MAGRPPPEPFARPPTPSWPRPGPQPGNAFKVPHGPGRRRRRAVGSPRGAPAHATDAPRPPAAHGRIGHRTDGRVDARSRSPGPRPTPTSTRSRTRPTPSVLVARRPGAHRGLDDADAAAAAACVLVLTHEDAPRLAGRPPTRRWPILQSPEVALPGPDRRRRGGRDPRGGPGGRRPRRGRLRRAAGTSSSCDADHPDRYGPESVNPDFAQRHHRWATSTAGPGGRGRWSIDDHRPSTTTRWSRTPSSRLARPPSPPGRDAAHAPRLDPGRPHRPRHRSRRCSACCRSRSGSSRPYVGGGFGAKGDAARPRGARRPGWPSALAGRPVKVAD